MYYMHIYSIYVCVCICALPLLLVVNKWYCAIECERKRQISRHWQGQRWCWARSSSETGYLIHFMRIYGNLIEQWDKSSNSIQYVSLLTEWKRTKVNKGMDAAKHSLWKCVQFQIRKRIRPFQDPFNWFHWCHLSHWTVFTVHCLLLCRRVDSILGFLHPLRYILPKIKNQCLRAIDRIVQ